MVSETPDIEPVMSSSGSLSGEYFDSLYSRCNDPWDFTTSNYEAKKYAATLAALSRERYARALELGCSIGVLTAKLALRCKTLLAVDIAGAALEQARRRCQQFRHVRFEQLDIVQKFPDGTFDLIVFSEVGYYFSAGDLERTRAAIASALVPGGDLLLVHYTGTTNYPLTADAVHDAFIEQDRAHWIHLKALSAERYRLDLLQKNRAGHA